MNEKTLSATVDNAGEPNVTADTTRRQVAFKASALQSAILHNANLSIIATDETGIIQFFNVGAERMFGYAATDVVNKTNPCDLQDLDELMARAETLSLEYGAVIKPGFDALTFKAARDIQDIYEATFICKDGSRLPVSVSVTVLRGDAGETIGYLLLGNDNAVKKRVDAELTSAKLTA